MPRFFVPTTSEGGSEYLQPILDRNKIPMIHIDKLRELIAYTAPEAETVFAIPTTSMQLLASHGAELLEEMPVIMLGVPDINYPTGWSASASIFPSISFREFEKQHLKSGHVVQTVGALDSGIDDAPDPIEESEFQ